MGSLMKRAAKIKCLGVLVITSVTTSVTTVITTLITTLITLVTLTTLVACQSQGPKGQQSSDGTSWSGKMQSMATVVRDLLPLVYSKTAFYSADNRSKIRAQFSKLGENAHKITPAMGKDFLGDDPLVQYSLENLSDDIKRAQHSFDLGQLEYSRGVTKSVVNHCFRCHSLVKIGASAHWDLNNIDSLSLSPMEKVDLLVAARKYDQALAQSESYLNSAEYIDNFPFDYEGVLRRYLALVIRIQGDPQRALAELDTIAAKPKVPYYIAEQIRSWRQSLGEWKREIKKKTKPNGNLLARARERLRRGEELQQYQRDHAGDVEYLRATVMLHEALRGQKSAAGRGEILYLLGKCYEVLDDLGSWNLHEAYYESCVKAAPKTAIAKSCYGRLEASIYLGYSGSSGMNVPAEERERLQKLKALTE